MIWRHLFGYMPVNLANGLVGFGSVFLFTRLLGADDYGRYALILSALNILHTITLTWAEAAAYRFAGRAEAEGRLADHYKTALTLGLISCGPALVLIGAVWAALHVDPELQRLVPILAVLLPLNVITNIALESHRAERRIARYSMVETFRLVGSFIAGVMLAWLGGLGALSPFVGMAVVWAIAAASEGRWLLANGKSGQVEASQSRAYMVYGLPIAAALVLDLMLSSADRFLIAYFIDEAAVGAYAAGYGVADKTILMLCAWGAMAGSPLLMAAYESGKPSDIRVAGTNMIGTLLLVAVPAALGIGLVAEPLATFMISEDLRDQAIEIIPWIALAGLLNGLLIYYFSEAFQLTRRTALRAMLMIVPAILNIGLNIWLLPQYGLMGAVYATVFTYAVAIVLLGLVGNRLLPLPIPMLDTLKIAAGCAGMAAIVLMLPDFGGFFELVLKAGFGAVTYGLIVILLDASGARALFQSGLNRLRRVSAAESA